jgi:hypothetical protein
VKLRLSALLLALLPVVALAGGYKSASLSDDQAVLRITLADGSRFDAPRFAEQVAYSEPRVSTDGRYVGWLALYPNCCTSYPIALKLVVLDESRHLHTFEGTKIAIFAWCFHANARSVAYAQGVLHGSDYRHFELRRISDERLLAEYEYPHEESALAQTRAPSWVRCVPE